MKRGRSGLADKLLYTALVHFEVFDNAELAFLREIQVIKYRREKKNRLVEKVNPGWLDLSKDLWK